MKVVFPGSLVAAAVVREAAVGLEEIMVGQAASRAAW